MSWKDEDYPSVNQVRQVLPEGSTEPDTAQSLGYLSVSVLGTAACTAAGIGALPILNPANPLTWPLWSAYAAVTGTVAMGLWVLAHECGHGAFSKNKKLQDAVGYTLHTLFLVPYFSWQRSHAVHHQYTNNIELGETHVPELATEEDQGSLDSRRGFLDKLGEEKGTVAWGVWQSFLHLVTGWPAYLLIGATGGKDRGMTNHYYPEPLQPEDDPVELFPGAFKEKVYQSDIGIAAVVAGIITWSICHGPAEMMAIYGGPYLVVNAWLVLYTWYVCANIVLMLVMMMMRTCFFPISGCFFFLLSSSLVIRHVPSYTHSRRFLFHCHMFCSPPPPPTCIYIYT